MEVSIERRAAGAADRELKFKVGAQSLDTHTHGELTRVDQQAIRDELAKCADAVEAILRKQA